MTGGAVRLGRSRQQGWTAPQPPSGAGGSAPRALLRLRRLIASPSGGTGSLAGVVTLRGVPVSRQVLCFDVLTKQCVASMWSDPATGAFNFNWLSTYRYFRVEAVDYSKTYNAVVADWVMPQ